MFEDVHEVFKEKFEPLMAKTMAQNRIPGLSLAMVKDGNIIYMRGFGARNLEANLPVTPQTLCGVGSVTKSFTALAIMQLVEQDQLTLDTPVQSYLPVKLGTKENPVTLHHLLTHTSGLPGLGTSEIRFVRMVGVDEKWIPMSSWDDLYTHINSAVKSTVVAPPGERFLYCNAGYLMLGNIIERVSGVNYETYIKEKILTPLMMNRSTFLKEVLKNDPNVMTPYLVESKDEQTIVTATKHPYSPLSFSVGGLLTSVMELSNYLVAMMNGGMFENETIVNASLLRTMHTNHTSSIEFSPLGGFYGNEGYGYGWMIADDCFGQKLIHHAGSTGVSSGLLMFIPDLNIGLAYTSNGGESPRAILLGALALLLGKDPIKEIPFLAIEQKFNRLCGVYETYQRFLCLSIVKKGGLLFLESKQRLMEMSFPLIPTSESVETLKFSIYTAPGAKRVVEFTIDGEKIDMYLDRWHLHKVS